MVAEIKKWYTSFTTDWGHVVAVWTDKGLWELSFPRTTAALAAQDITTLLTERKPSEIGPETEQLQLQLNMYFRGFNEPFAVAIDWRNYTQFQTAVLKYTAQIPYGRLTTYGALAREIGSPKAARAVGGALHINRTPIIVPCHRVVGSNGNLTGFGGGIDMKKALLMLEKNIASTLSDRL